MTADPNFQPVFGPNGAVINAPSMTPEMLKRLERASRPPTGKELMREFRTFAIPAFAVLLWVSLSGPTFEFLKSSTWWSGAFAGVTASAALLAVLYTINRNLSRWELRKSQRFRRHLEMPEWARWSFASADSIAASGFAVVLAISLNDFDREFAVVFWGLIPFGAVAVSGVLQFVGRRCGWKLRADLA